MSSAKWQRYNIALYAGTALALYLTLREAVRILQGVKRDVRISEKKEEVPEFFNQATEDAVSNETLETLSRSPNLDMAAAARRMIIDRYLRNPKYHSLLMWNITGKAGREKQEEALTTLRYLMFSALVNVPRQETTLTAVVIAIRNRLPDVRTRAHEPDTDWKLRTQGERDALFVLGCQLEVDAPSLIKTTNLVHEWIAKYPFGGANATQARKLEVVDRIIRNQTDDELLYRILSCIHRTALGRKQLRAVGLIGSAIREGDMSSDGDIPAYVDEATSIRMPPDSPGDPGEDPEARLRRRRRNAVVFEDTPD